MSLTTMPQKAAMLRFLAPGVKTDVIDLVEGDEGRRQDYDCISTRL